MSLFGVLIMALFTFIFILIVNQLEKNKRKQYAIDKENDQRFKSKSECIYQTKFKRR